MAVEINTLDPLTLSVQSYDAQETNLIPTFEVNTSLSTGSYIELFIYNTNQTLIYEEYNFTQYSVLNNGQSAGNNNALSQIEIDVEQVVTDLSYSEGSYITYFNFLNKKIGSNIETLYITEISSDRTELRLDSTILTNSDIIEKANAFIQERNDSTYFLDFYLNFGENNLYIANNLVLDNEDPLDSTILVKLYDPLPEEYDINSTLWIVTSIEEPLAYEVNFINEPIEISDTTPIQGPNFNIPIKDQINNSTNEYSYLDLVSTPISSSFTQLNSLLEEKELDINVDYTKFNEFIHFSSAQTRLENFFYKVNIIEEYSSSLSIINSSITGPTSLTPSISESKAILEAKINEITKYFDGWEYYMYYSSGSWAWPKLNNEPPYQLASVNSNDVLTWFGSTNESSPLYGGIILSASLYDNNNKDNLLFSIPEYLRDDPENDQYELFIDMVAQHFDNIWIYYKDVTNKYNADNRLEQGISKDIVADAIRDFGVKLYQNNFSNNDLYTAFLGLTPNGALFPFPNITGSFPAPSGFEYIDNLISASNDYMPLDDVNKSLYKRIYHNLPYLLKSKGTLPGLRALITSYGIPDTVLRINEYGGKDKINSNDWDYWQNEFNYAFSTSGSNFISSSWGLNPAWNAPNDTPATLMFRFKTEGLPTTNIPYSQSLWYGDGGCAITLTYTGSAYTSESYSGSIIDPYYQYATLTFYPDVNISSQTASVYLPFYDKGWWSVMVTKDSNTYTLYSQNKIYEGGNNGTLLGFTASNSVTYASPNWDNTLISYFPVSFSVLNPEGYDISTYDVDVYDGGSSLVGSYTAFSGSYQEIRYYTVPISESVFSDYTMNPYSIEGNSLNNTPNELAFRASIGGELYTASISIHPKVTGSWGITQSFISDSNFYYDASPNFVSNREYFFFDQPIAGIKNTVSDKIRLEDNTLPSGSTLSPFRPLSQTIEASASYTPNINLLEVALSPQNEINEDIMGQLGFFNIGDFIGNPAFRSSRLTSYSDLDNLRNAYFEKYTKNYNLVDFIRLIKFFDNSLFKMIQDFVPARTSLASGVVIKQHLLERNRYPQPQADNHSTIAFYTTGSGSTPQNNNPLTFQDITISGTLKPQWNNYNPGTVENFSGGTGGSFEIFNGINTSPYGIDGNGPNNIFSITQSWDDTYNTPLGIATTIHDSQEEFYDGEFSGSVILVTTQSLNIPYPLENASFEYTPILYRNTLYDKGNFSTFTEGQFLNPLTTPSDGEILIMFPRWRFVGFFVFSIVKRKAFVKISKKDCNGNNNSTALGQITNLLIKYTTGTSYINYEVLSINEHPLYYLYEISNQNINVLNPGIIDTEVKDYYVSSSNTSSFNPFLLIPVDLDNYVDGTFGNIQNYFDTASGYYTLGNTPNVTLNITASFAVSSVGITSGLVKVGIFHARNNTIIQSVSTDVDTSLTPLSVNVTGSFYPLKGDQIFLRKGGYTGPATLILDSYQLLITQSVSPTASVCDPIILEPYLTTPNFYNSDENGLINNAVDIRQNSFIQDADYSSGVMTPTNFNLLISGTAIPATIPDSNYTLLRHINPRYNGSRTTSQQLNIWTPGDINTYGKLSTIETPYSLITYCEFDGGYPPEHMNAVGAKIKYLIDQNFTVTSPSLTPESVSDIQNAFRTNEYVRLDYITDSNASSTKRIIRGGYRIEPIFYNQIGHYLQPAGVNTFTGSIEITNISNNNSSIIPNYTLVKSPIAGIANATNFPYDQTIQVSNVFSGLNFYQVISAGSALTPSEIGTTANVTGNRFTITSALLGSGITALTFKAVARLKRVGDNSPYVQIAIQRDRGGVVATVAFSPSATLSTSTINTFVAEYSCPITDLQAGDFFTVSRIATSTGNAKFYTDSSFFTISQTPYPTPPLPVSGSGGNLFFTASLNPNSIYSTSSQFITYYGDSSVRQKDISGSGFFPIKYPIEFFPGDEIRFEGNEDYVYMVKEVTKTSGSFSFATSSINIELDKPISGSGLNINQFLIRRYIEDGSIIIFESTNGDNGDGTLFARPQYVTNELKGNINTLIPKLSIDNLI